jgi:hypothetical protein
VRLMINVYLFLMGFDFEQLCFTFNGFNVGHCLRAIGCDTPPLSIL